jgi:hypothetical protein
MSIWSDLASEIPKLVMEATFSAVGFFVALGINSWIDRRKEAEVFRSILQAIRAEATSNMEVIEDSYGQYFPGGIVLRDFNTSIVSQSVGNSLFVRHASGEDLRVFGQYIRVLTLTNSYRRVAESLEFMTTDEKRKLWLSTIKGALGNSVKQAKQEILAVQKTCEQ